MKLENIPAPTLVKRQAMELTHELHERGYETDGQVKYAHSTNMQWPSWWELSFFKGTDTYHCEFLDGGTEMRIIVDSTTSAFRNNPTQLLDDLESILKRGNVPFWRRKFI